MSNEYVSQADLDMRDTHPGYNIYSSVTNTTNQSISTTSPPNQNFPPNQKSFPFEYGGQRVPLGPLVTDLENRLRSLEGEYREIAKLTRDLRSVLGMPNIPDGTIVQITTALREIILEIDRRTDGMIGNIDKTICL